MDETDPTPPEITDTRELSGDPPAGERLPEFVVADGPVGMAVDAPRAGVADPPRVDGLQRIGQEVITTIQTLLSAGVYATLIVTFIAQIARVDGMSMAPTLEDHDRLIVNKLVYEISDPRP